MSKVGNVIKGTIDVLSPDQSTSRLTFRKFNGYALAAAAENGTEIGDGDILTVSLKVNPEEVSFDKPKIIQKVQTSAPGRFVVFDWGTDLTTISINGNTGNMLPGIVQSGFNPFMGLIEDIGAKFDPGGTAKIRRGNPSGWEEAKQVAQQVMFDTMSYTEMLELSPKYRTFKKLESLYDIFDADADVLTLEMDENVYRGYFMEFSFAITANMPWNWQYNIVFVSLADLSTFLRRNDSPLPAIDGVTVGNE